MENQEKPLNFNDYNYIGKAEIEKNFDNFCELCQYIM